MDKIKMSQKEFDELYEITGPMEDEVIPIKEIDKPETVLNEEEQVYDDVLEELTK